MIINSLSTTETLPEVLQ